MPQRQRLGPLQRGVWDVREGIQRLEAQELALQAMDRPLRPHQWLMVYDARCTIVRHLENGTPWSTEQVHKSTQEDVH